VVVVLVPVVGSTPEVEVELLVLVSVVPSPVDPAVAAVIVMVIGVNVVVVESLPPLEQLARSPSTTAARMYQTMAASLAGQPGAVNRVCAGNSRRIGAPLLDLGQERAISGIIRVSSGATMGSDPHSLMFLGVSVAVLLVGPGIHRVAAREPVTMAALDNFVLVAIVGLVALEIVPGALQLAGLPALLALVLGALGPALADGPLHRAARGTHRTALVLAVLGMAIHSFTDGLALASAHVAGGRSHALEIAVIAHQLPVAVAVWWLLSPAGLLRASAAMLVLGLATILGFLLADRSLAALAPAWLGILQGLFAGLLLHVVAHRTHTAESDLRSRIAAALGGLAGLGLLTLLVHDAGHAHDGDPLARVLLALAELARASAPAVLLGLLVLGLLAAWAPAPHRLLGARAAGPLAQAVGGSVLGVLRPLRAPTLLPALHTLKRAPASTRLAYLIAAPTLGIDVLLLSYPLLGGGLTLARGLGAVVLAVIVGSVVGRRGGPVEPGEPGEPTPGHTPLARMFAALDAALPWLALGLVLAATLAPWLSPVARDGLFPSAIPTWLQIPLIAALGLPVHLCAAGVTPVIAVLLAAGLSPGAGLAFLLTAPTVSVAGQRLLTRLHGRRLARTNLVLVFLIAVVCGLGIDLALDATSFAPPILGVLRPDAPAHGLASDLALAALVGLMLVSLLRQTPQQFLRRLWVSDASDASDAIISDGHHDHAAHTHGRWHTRHTHFSSRGPHTP